MCTIVCLFVFFTFSHGVVSLFSICEFDCPSGIFLPSFISLKVMFKLSISLKWITVTTTNYVSFSGILINMDNIEF